VWSLPPSGKRAGRTAAVEVDVAHAWIVANRTGREPWQRADEALAALRSVGATTQALAVRNGAEEICGALIYRDRGDAVTALQIAAADERAAAELLLAAGGDGREVRLSNLATDHVATAAFGSLGARSVVKQYEMVLQLPTVAPPVASEDL
jgi:hypothetical protein